MSLYDWATTEHENPQVKRNRQYAEYTRQGSPGKFNDWLDQGGGANVSGTTPSFAEGVKQVGGFVPGLGEAIDAKNAYDNLQQGNYGKAALNTAAMLAGAVPLAGDLAATGIRSLGYADEVADAARASNFLGGIGDKASRAVDQIGNTVGLAPGALDVAQEAVVQAPRALTGTADATWGGAADDDDGWDAAPPPSDVPQQIDAGSPAAPAAQPMNQAPPQAAQEASKGLLAGAPTMQDLAGDTGTPSAQTSLGGGSIGAPAAAAALLPNPFLTSGPASAGFAPQLAGLLPTSFGSTAVPISQEQREQQASITGTPDRYYDKANPILDRLGFSGWKTYTPEEQAENINSSNRALGIDDPTEVRVDQNDDSLFYSASSWDQGASEEGTDFTTSGDDDGWDSPGTGTTWTNSSGSKVETGFGAGQVDPSLARAAGYTTQVQDDNNDNNTGAGTSWTNPGQGTTGNADYEREAFGYEDNSGGNDNDSGGGK